MSRPSCAPESQYARAASVCERPIVHGLGSARVRCLGEGLRIMLTALLLKIAVAIGFGLVILALL
jgi:hypothetical protein